MPVQHSLGNKFQAFTTLFENMFTRTFNLDSFLKSFRPLLSVMMPSYCTYPTLNGLDLGQPRLWNFVNVYTNSSNWNNSIYIWNFQIGFFIMQISKITNIFPKNSLKNVLCVKIQNCWVRCCDRTHFKYLESDCKMCRLPDSYITNNFFSWKCVINELTRIRYNCQL